MIFQLSIFMPPSVFVSRRLSAISGPSQTACLAPWSRLILVYMMFSLCCTNLSLRFPFLVSLNFTSHLWQPWRSISFSLLESLYACILLSHFPPVHLLIPPSELLRRVSVRIRQFMLSFLPLLCTILDFLEYSGT
ncbi:hypothetical protein BO78DRAFT_205100 [Aspergillus sclerotiicarbonarius CBS 121057]|uniref:Uncharacterized protein n=1 Tax=Aspergillus sclerotiicarbonarius (strain CBS 121057 / IBT 28362) TaxID=1448318 RepID=A0A319EK01_ASPSB|nr:hypothetical protein BO78DRAFT_205100 [Aspergillus sclerotiicarbonarius CBS 121057]